MRGIRITQKFTKRNDKSLEKYLNDISKISKQITPEEEVALARRIHQGDSVALEKLVIANLNFVVSIAKHYQNQGMSLGELINEGNIGLIKAAGRFDETRGFKFISYAVWWIRQSILQSLADNNRIVRLPLNKLDAVKKVIKMQIQLEQKLERETTHEEIAEALNWEVNEVQRSLERYSTRHLSIDAPISNDESNDTTLLDVLATSNEPEPDTVLITESLKTQINEILPHVLNDKEHEVVKAYFGLDGTKYTLEEISEKVGLTRERVRQIKEKALRRLRKSKYGQRLKAYLG